MGRRSPAPGLPREGYGKSDRSACIDRDASKPPYLQLAEILEARLASGMVRPGNRLPSEAQLCERYGVSPMTVRRAISTLLGRGLIRTIPGKGTFAKAVELSEGTFGLDAFRMLFAAAGRPRVKLLEARISPADARTARKLAVPEGRRVILLRRLLSNDEGPVLYHREQLVYDPTRPVVEGEMDATSLQGLFSGEGQTDLKGGDLVVEATTLAPDEAGWLGGGTGQAAFRLAHTFYGFDDRPVSWGWFICRGDRLRFRTTVGILQRVERDGLGEDHEQG